MVSVDNQDLSFISLSFDFILSKDTCYGISLITKIESFISLSSDFILSEDIFYGINFDNQDLRALLV